MVDSLLAMQKVGSSNLLYRSNNIWGVKEINICALLTCWLVPMHKKAIREHCGSWGSIPRRSTTILIHSPQGTKNEEQRSRSQVYTATAHGKAAKRIGTHAWGSLQAVYV